jgi:membrane protein insertase Oxa1/YidC/SpoIIIJ
MIPLVAMIFTFTVSGQVVRLPDNSYATMRECRKYQPKMQAILDRKDAAINVTCERTADLWSLF